MTPRSELISKPVLFVFCVLVLSSLALIVPNDFDIAKLLIASFRNHEALPLLRKAHLETPHDPRVLRTLSEVLEFEGNLKEAAELTRQLTELRPQNQKYWNRLLRLYREQESGLLVAKTVEKMMALGMKTQDEESLFQLASDYEWLDKNEEALRIYDQIFKLGAYSKKTSDVLLSAWLRMGEVQTAKSFVIKAVKNKRADSKLHKKLAYHFIHQKDYKNASQHMALYFGSSPLNAKNAWENPSFIRKLSRNKIHQHKETILELVWLYIEHGNTNNAYPILDKLSRMNLLSIDQRLSYADVLYREGRVRQNFKQLRALSKDKNLDVEDWHGIARRFLWAGDNRTAAIILEDLLSGIRPNLDKPHQRRTRNLKWKFVQNLTLRDATFPYGDYLLTALDYDTITLTPRERLQTYRLLLDVYQASENYQGITSLIERWLSENKLGTVKMSRRETNQLIMRLAQGYYWQKNPQKTSNILEARKYSSLDAEMKALLIFALVDQKEFSEAESYLNRLTQTDWLALKLQSKKRLQKFRTWLAQMEKERILADNQSAIPYLEQRIKQAESQGGPNSRSIPLREKLAERYIWTERPDTALKTLRAVPFRKLSAKAKAMGILALVDTGAPQKARPLVARLSISDRQKLDTQTQNRLSDLENRSFASTSAEGIAPAPSHLASFVDQIRYAHEYGAAESTTLFTGSLTAPALQLEYGQRLSNSAWSLMGQIEASSISAADTNLIAARAGAGIQSDSNRYQFWGGAITGGEYFPVQLKMLATGPILFADWCTLAFELSKPLWESQQLTRLGVSETRLTLFWEKRLSDWFTLSADSKLRLSHISSDLAKGQGAQLSLRGAFAKIDARFRIGPWVHFVRWGSNDPQLSPLLVEQASVLGAVASYDIGGGDRMAWKSRLTAGWGIDLSAESGKFETGLLETSLEKLFTQTFGGKLSYALYTSQFSQNIGSGTHIVKLSLFKEL